MSVTRVAEIHDYTFGYFKTLVTFGDWSGDSSPVSIKPDAGFRRHFTFRREFHLISSHQLCSSSGSPRCLASLPCKARTTDNGGHLFHRGQLRRGESGQGHPFAQHCRGSSLTPKPNRPNHLICPFKPLSGLTFQLFLSRDGVH